MSNLPIELQSLTTGLSSDKSADIEKAILSSPHLFSQITRAVREDHLDHIRLTAIGANEGGHYDSKEKSIYINPDVFTEPQLQRNETRRLDKITGILGHETEHAFQAKNSRTAVYDLNYQAEMKIRDGSLGLVDMTENVGAYLRTARKNEASAEIENWNAVASRVMTETGGKVTSAVLLKRLAETTDCVDGPIGKNKSYSPAAGIVFEDNFQMSDDRLPKRGPINLEPVSKCFFDQKPGDTGLGKDGKSDYTNYYGAGAISIIQDVVRRYPNPPTIAIDMKQLGLKPTLLESTGLDLNGENLSVFDSSRGQSKFITLHHTGSGNTYSPKAERDEPEVAKAVQLNEPSHSGFHYYQQALGLIQGSKEIPDGSLSKEQQERLAANASAEALQDDPQFRRFDHALLSKPDPETGQSKNLILVQGAIHDPAHNRAAVNIESAIATPISQSTEVMNTALQTQKQVQQYERQQSQQQSQQQEQTQNPVMKMSKPGPSGGSSGGDGGGG